MQTVLSANQKVMSGDGNILYLPIGGTPSGAAAPAEAPVLRLPVTQAASPEPTTPTAERPRADGRPGGR